MYTRTLTHTYTHPGIIFSEHDLMRGEGLKIRAGGGVMRGFAVESARRFGRQNSTAKIMLQHRKHHKHTPWVIKIQ